MTRFEAEASYAECLREAMRASPGAYTFGEGMIPTVATKMVEAMKLGTFDKSGGGLRRFCRKHGIAYTRVGIYAWAQENIK